MKLLKLHINGFGRWIEQEINFQPGFNLIYGPNEAGKSTLLQFILAMFYGLGDLRGKSLLDRPRERFQPWSGTAYGGTITFADATMVYKLERSFGKSKNLDKIRLLDAATGMELPLPAGQEPGEHLFKMSQSEFRNSVFTAQASSAVANENEMKRRLSATMTGSEALISSDEMLKQLDDIIKNLSSERRQDSLLLKLRKDEAKLSREQTEALNNHLEIERLNAVIKTLDLQLDQSKEEKAELHLQLELDKKAAENAKIREGLALVERQAALQAELETASEYLNTGSQALTEADLDAVSKLLNEWSAYESGMSNAENLRAEQSQKILRLEEGGKTASRVQNLTELLEKRQALDKELLAMKDKKSKAEQEYVDQKHALEQNIAEQQMTLLKIQTEHKDRLKGLEDAALRKTQLTHLQENQLKNLSKQEALQIRLKAAEDLLAQTTQTKSELKKEQEKLRAINQEHAGWESNWDINARKNTAFTVLLVTGLLSLLVTAVALLFKAELWPWILLAFGLMAVFLALWFKARLSAERKNFVHDRELINKNNEKLIQLSANMEHHEKQLAWAEAQAAQLLNDSRDLHEEKRVMAERLAALRIEVSENAGENIDTNLLKEEWACAENLAEQEVKKLREQLDRLSFKIPDELSIQESIHTNAAFALQQEMHLEGLEDELQLTSALELEKHKLSQTFHAKANLQELETLLADYGEKREHLQTQVQILSKKRIRTDSLHVAESDLEELQNRFETLRQLEQNIERLGENIQHKLAAMTQAQAVLRLEENRLWLEQNGLVETLLAAEAKNEMALDMAAVEAKIERLRESLWRNREQLKTALNKTRMPAQIERELAMNKAAITEVVAESASLEQAQKWIREADQEQRRSFGPAINAKFGEILAGLSGIPEVKLLVSNDFDIRLEDADSGIAHERDYFSAGKIDQLHLALRLAIVESVYMHEMRLPLIFDDSFVQFDSTRTRTALDFLMQLTRKRDFQIIFTSCHQAIIDVMQGQGDVTVLDLSR